MVDSKTGEELQNEKRSSNGVFLPPGLDPTIAAFEQRIANWALLPVENGEPFQLLRYNSGEKHNALSCSGA